VSTKKSLCVGLNRGYLIKNSRGQTELVRRLLSGGCDYAIATCGGLGTNAPGVYLTAKGASPPLTRPRDMYLHTSGRSTDMPICVGMSDQVVSALFRQEMLSGALHGAKPSLFP
jgi:hypothetical protein